MSETVNRQVALFQPRFLSISMTFIYRQLLGISDDYEPLVMATQAINRENFPYERLETMPKSPVEKLYSTAVRKLWGRYLPMWTGRRKHWASVLDKNDIRLIHAHFGYSGLEILPLARSKSIPLLVTFHGADASNMLESRHYVKDLQALFEYASVITVSETMAERLEVIGANRDKMFVHYIGAPVEDFSFVERRRVGSKVEHKETVTLLQVSNFVEKKGHEYTLEAFARLLKHYSDCRLVLAGGGPLKESCEKQASRLGLSDRVEFVGPVTKNEVIRLMGEADVFVHHSVTARNGSQEGLPTVLMEAMGTGLPVVTTRHAGIPELVEDGHNGYLVEERDIDEYASKLVEALNAPADMPQRAAETVLERFNISVQNQKLKKIYTEVMGTSS